MIEQFWRRFRRRPARLRLVKSGRDTDPSGIAPDGAGGAYERMILARLHRGGGARIADILEAVVDEALRDEQIRGGWVCDIGVWGPSLIRRDVMATFGSMLGRSLILEGDAEGPWLVAPVAAS
jgi:hypothetical protein